MLQTPLWNQDKPLYKSRDSQQTSGKTENDPLMLTFTFLVQELDKIGATVFLQPGRNCEFATPTYPQRFSYQPDAQVLKDCSHVHFIENPATVRVGDHELLVTDVVW